MKTNKTANILRWVARIYGGIVLLFFLVVLFGYLTGKETFNTDWRNYVMHFSLIVGLLVAYKWELIGGTLTTIGILVSGFIHPLVLFPGVIYMVYGFMMRGNSKSTD